MLGEDPGVGPGQQQQPRHPGGGGEDVGGDGEGGADVGDGESEVEGGEVSV